MEAAGIEPALSGKHESATSGQLSNDAGQQPPQPGPCQEVRSRQTDDQRTQPTLCPQSSGHSRNTIEAQPEHNTNTIQLSADLTSIASAWDQLPDHVRRTICDLVVKNTTAPSRSASSATRPEPKSSPNFTKPSLATFRRSWRTS